MTLEGTAWIILESDVILASDQIMKKLMPVSLSNFSHESMIGRILIQMVMVKLPGK